MERMDTAASLDKVVEHQLPPPAYRERDHAKPRSRSPAPSAINLKEHSSRTINSRIIYVNDAGLNATLSYPSNSVTTAKYNYFTFVPIFLYEQFSKYANLFFLFTAIIQQIPGVTPTSRFTTAVPLGIVLLASAAKEIYEDTRRHHQDRVVNNSVVQVLAREGTFSQKQWHELQVGDIVRIEEGGSFPADLVLLSSSEPDGLCYTETSSLDGETNLKIRQSKSETAMLCTPADMASLQGFLVAENPSNSLYTFEGNLQSGGKIMPLDPEQLLLRGSVLRNTKWIYAIVIYTGHDTKLMRNASKAPLKRTRVERMTNVQIVILFFVLIMLSLVSAIFSFVDIDKFKKTYAYLNLSGNATVGDFFLNFLTFIILYNNLIPISLVVTMEIVKFQQASLINDDLDMYYSPQDTPAAARTSNLVEELGQVEYVFSDKTGTLTCNHMELKQCIIGGVLYMETISRAKMKPARAVGGIESIVSRSENTGADHSLYDFKALAKQALEAREEHRILRQFLTMLAVCHTVIPERPEDSSQDMIYQASSPDEGALVKGAAELGFKFTIRRPRSVTIQVAHSSYEYQILNVLEFNSARKRMSVIVRTPEGKIMLYTKGADTVILERLATHNPHVERTMELLEDCATEGLRTLCLAQREISESEYQAWSRVYDEATTTMFKRSEALDQTAEAIERDLFFLGATAVEDRLQDGVPETIHVLAQAGIKIWVLTGDRQETAINIGYSCKLLTEDNTLIIVNESSRESTREFLESRLKAIHAIYNTAVPNVDHEVFSLIIDGRSLEHALEMDIQKTFFDLAHQCKAVICCRVSPLQKALVVEVVKKYSQSVLLAIGDGANDVSMIQAAHIGIGISGAEGLQAARSADYSIGQFRYLRKLLLVHGSWSYQRLSKLILYSFYKNITLYMTQFWFSWFNLYSGQTFYESWIISLYNVIFTFWPPVMIGVTDQHITARQLDSYPQLYTLGQRGEFFNVRSFWGWTINAMVHSLVLFFVVMAVARYDLALSDGTMAGQWFVGTILYTSVLMTVLCKAALITTNWTKFAFIAILGSMISWFVFLPLYDLAFPPLGVAKELDGITVPLYSSAVFWLTIVILPVICLFRDFCWKYLKRQYFPRSYHIIQEFQKFNISDYRPRMDRFRRAIHKVRMIQRMKRNRGYAFSQGDTGQANLIRLYDTTKTKPPGI